MFNANDLTKDKSYNYILQPVFDDLKKLEDEGICISYKENEIKLFGALIGIIHDNLPANCLLGFSGGFSANYYCRVCEMHKDNANNCFKEIENLLRTKESLKKFSMCQNTNLTMTKGVKFFSILNHLSYYDVIKNNTVDPMHDILEGIAPLVLMSLLNKLVELKKISFDGVNERIRFHQYGQLHRSCLPTAEISKDKKMSLSASESWCLLIHFAYIFGDLITDDLVEHWEVIVNLLKKTHLVFAKEIKMSEIDELETQIYSFLNSIVNVFKLTITPKCHLLTHYPNIIRKM